MIEIQKTKCSRCGATWSPRVSSPVKCPRCQSLSWHVQIDEKETGDKPAKTAKALGQNFEVTKPWRQRKQDGDY